MSGLDSGSERVARAWMLRRYGFADDVIAAVMLLSRKQEGDTRTYAQYIDDIAESRNKLAMEVKLADLSDHLEGDCPERLRPRYLAAWPVLQQAWWRL